MQKLRLASERTMYGNNKSMSYVSRRDVKKTNKLFQAALEEKKLSQHTREYDILERIYTFFSTPGMLDRIIPYIEESKSQMSLRDFEEFNVHVAPWINAYFYNDIVYPGTNGKVYKDIFIVYQKYKAYLKCYNKETFDPFRRGIAFEFYYTKFNKDTGEYEQHSIFTAICQMNYFMWCLSNGVLDYIEQNLELIHNSIDLIEDKRKEISKDDFKMLILKKQQQPRCYTIVA